MRFKIKGSHELIRDFCQVVRFGIRKEFNLKPHDETVEQLCDDLIEMFHWNAQFISEKMPIPLSHIEVWSDDKEDDEMVEWIKTEPDLLIQVFYLHFAEQILNAEVQKIQKQIVA